MRQRENENVRGGAESETPAWENPERRKAAVATATKKGQCPDWLNWECDCQKCEEWFKAAITTGRPPITSASRQIYVEGDQIFDTLEGFLNARSENLQANGFAPII